LLIDLVECYLNFVISIHYKLIIFLSLYKQLGTREVRVNTVTCSVYIVVAKTRVLKKLCFVYTCSGSRTSAATAYSSSQMSDYRANVFNLCIIIVLFLIVKLPQILKILAAKSGVGLSMLSIYLELLAVTSSCAYGYNAKFPFRYNIIQSLVTFGHLSPPLHNSE